MAPQDPAETPRKGQYIPVALYYESEGGGTLEYRTAKCKTCLAIVDEDDMSVHEGWHESMGGSDPKKM